MVFFDTLHWLTCLAIILVLVFSDTLFNMSCNHTPTFRAGCSHRRNTCSIFSNHTVTADMETCFHWIETDNKEVSDHTSRSIGTLSPDNLTRRFQGIWPKCSHRPGSMLPPAVTEGWSGRREGRYWRTLAGLSSLRYCVSQTWAARTVQGVFFGKLRCLDVWVKIC